ncbi:MAG TPA: hypothetical protein VEW67_05175 [Thermoleophilaceae bacterium]|nr:hypothetical protein [Thermoleophilaceae bacterium]
MNAQVSSAVVVLAGAAALAASAHGSVEMPATASAKGAPLVDQMVVFRGGRAIEGPVRAARTTTTVGRRTCGIAAATSLAALVRSKPGRIGFHDYGSCSRRSADSAGLFVKALRGQRNRGQDGWVYKVGHKLATAGAADPTGPFGNGRLRAGDDVVWFYCSQFSNGTCQRSLAVETTFDAGRLTVAVHGYDDAGDAIEIAGATVHAGGRKATTDAQGRATLALERGRHKIFASKKGTIRSFSERVTVK